MAKKKSNNTNSDNTKLLASLAHRGIKSIDSQEITIDQLIAEGDLLLEEEAKSKPIVPAKEIPTKQKTPISNKSNYYLQARLQLFGEMDPKKVAMIKKMELAKDTNNDVYQCFVDNVVSLGDKLSNK